MSGARGYRRGEGERGDNENTLPLVGRVLGQVRLYEERGRGEGGQTETSTNIFERIQERRRYFVRYGDSALKKSRTLGGAPSPTPFRPHPSQVPTAAQVGGATPQTSGHWKVH